MSIAPDNITAYDVKVEKPEHIPELVNLTQKVGQNTPIMIGLDHQEGYEGRHAMRGRYEDFGDLEPGEEVFRRPDGGNTVYTDDSKYALTFGVPLEPSEDKMANSYAEVLHDFIDERTDLTFQRGERDLYLGGDQLVGVSQRFHYESAVLRAYWAEEMPETYNLMYKDGLSDEQVEAHQQAMQKSADVLGGQDFYQTVMEEFHADELKSGDFLSYFTSNPEKSAQELLEENGRHEAKVCFLERPEE
ncbi:MAG: hypothetical protein ACI977_000860 [Candidatus Nanohaloarchaea archaeon]|jgi:hypothetical protein